jgi:hypothetical protein
LVSVGPCPAVFFCPFPGNGTVPPWAVTMRRTPARVQ